MGIFDRTNALIGEGGLLRLQHSRVLVFGLGGVGGYVVEAIARAGVGTLGLVDCDVIDPTNINRQILALSTTIGRKKTEVASQRLLDINPNLKILAYHLRYDHQTADSIDFSFYDYIVDAIDSPKSKLIIITRAAQALKPSISCMGTGFRLDPTKLVIGDIFSTSLCPLARQMRRHLRKQGITQQKVLYSLETPISPSPQPQEEDTPSKTIASISFVPSVAGLLIASEVVRELLSSGNQQSNNE